MLLSCGHEGCLLNWWEHGSSRCCCLVARRDVCSYRKVPKTRENLFFISTFGLPPRINLTAETNPYSYHNRPLRHGIVWNIVDTVVCGNYRHQSGASNAEYWIFFYFLLTTCNFVVIFLLVKSCLFCHAAEWHFV